MLMEVEHASLFDIGHPIIQRTIEYLESFPLRTSDAIHLATAMEAGCDLFITSDLKQAMAAKKLGLQVSEIK
jgi:predicted nucleic acid-binding protein